MLRGTWERSWRSSVVARRRAPRPRGTRADGQHFLRSPRLAAELVDQAGVGAHDLVLEIGAGTGRLTTPLADRARQVIAVELDPACVAHPAPDVRRTRARRGRPRERARGAAASVSRSASFGNLPFSSGTRILRRLLDDPGADLVGLDAIVQFEMARKRASMWPSTLVSLGWLPVVGSLGRAPIPRRAFDPMPGVDAGVLPRAPARRRRCCRPRAGRRSSGSSRHGFARPDRPIGRHVPTAVPAATLRRLRRSADCPADATSGRARRVRLDRAVQRAREQWRR